MAEMHAELRFYFLFGRKLSGGTSISAMAIAGGHNAPLALRNATVRGSKAQTDQQVESAVSDHRCGLTPHPQAKKSELLHLDNANASIGVRGLQRRSLAAGLPGPHRA